MVREAPKPSLRHEGFFFAPLHFRAVGQLCFAWIAHTTAQRIASGSHWATGDSDQRYCEHRGDYKRIIRRQQRQHRVDRNQLDQHRRGLHNKWGRERYDDFDRPNHQYDDYPNHPFAHPQPIIDCDQWRHPRWCDYWNDTRLKHLTIEFDDDRHARLKLSVPEQQSEQLHCRAGDRFASHAVIRRRIV